MQPFMGCGELYILNQETFKVVSREIYTLVLNLRIANFHRGILPFGLLNSQIPSLLSVANDIALMGCGSWSCQNRNTSVPT